VTDERVRELLGGALQEVLRRAGRSGTGVYANAESHDRAVGYYKAAAQIGAVLLGTGAAPPIPEDEPDE
jgi:hypothetical protein